MLGCLVTPFMLSIFGMGFADLPAGLVGLVAVSGAIGYSFGYYGARRMPKYFWLWGLLYGGPIFFISLIQAFDRQVDNSLIDAMVVTGALFISLGLAGGYTGRRSLDEDRSSNILSKAIFVYIGLLLVGVIVLVVRLQASAISRTAVVINEARSFGQGRSDTACEDLTIAKIQNNHWLFNPDPLPAVFLEACLDVASLTNEFCASVPELGNVENSDDYADLVSVIEDHCDRRGD